MIINLTSDNLFLKSARCCSLNGYNLPPTFISKPERIVVPFILTAATPVGASNKILGLSSSPPLYINLYLTTYMVFIKRDFPTPAPP